MENIKKYNMKPLVISFSGGRTSAYMTYLLLNKYKTKREILVIFANTGKEREETLEFINNCDKYFGFNTVWIETVQHFKKGVGARYKIVNFETACRHGLPFESVIQKHGLPNMAYPHCSREMKKTPITAYIRNFLKWQEYDIALGIRADEPKRLGKKPNVIYPLANEFPCNKLMVNKWWANQPFNLQLKDYEGNCDMCWKKSKRKLLTIISENPNLANWWNEMEIKYGNYIPIGQEAKRLTPITFFRQNESASDLIEDSKIPFIHQPDAYTLDQLMFSLPEFDFEDGECGKSSCEAF